MDSYRGALPPTSGLAHNVPSAKNPQWLAHFKQISTITDPNFTVRSAGPRLFRDSIGIECIHEFSKLFVWPYFRIPVKEIVTLLCVSGYRFFHSHLGASSLLQVPVHQDDASGDSFSHERSGLCDPSGKAICRDSASREGFRGRRGSLRGAGSLWATLASGGRALRSSGCPPLQPTTQIALLPPPTGFRKAAYACIRMRRSPLLARKSNIEVLREVRRRKVPRIAFGEDFTDSLNATSN
jgi:hypothetical protein